MKSAWQMVARLQSTAPLPTKAPATICNELWSDYSPVVSATTLMVNNTPTSLAEEEEPFESVFFLPLIHR